MDFPFNNASACRVGGICSALKHDFVCKVYGYSKNGCSHGYFDDIEFENNKYPKSLLSYLLTFGSNRRIKNVLRSLNPKDIGAVFFTSIGHIQLKFLGKWCRKNKIPLVYDCGDLNIKSDKGILFRIIKFIEEKKFKKTVLKYSAVMAISSFLSSYYAKAQHVFVVPCIADIASQRFDSEPEKLDENSINIGYFGIPGKDFAKDRLDWCLEAFKRVSNSHINFYIAGISENELPVRCRSIRNVKYLGKISNNKCISIIKSLDFVTFFRENTIITKAGFASKITESFCLNTPLLTNLTGDMGQYLNNKNSIFVNGVDFESCLKLFDTLSNISKDQIFAMKSYLKKNNHLNASYWSEFLIENLNIIKEKFFN